MLVNNELNYKKYNDEEYQTFLSSPKLRLKLSFLSKMLNFRISTQKIVVANDKNNFSELEILRKYLKEVDVNLKPNELTDDCICNSLFLKTADNVNIKTTFIKSWVKNKSLIDEWVVLSHGINNSRQQAMVFGIELLRMGYNIAVFDHRGHGISDSVQVTAGINEAKDIQAVVDYLKKSYEYKHINFYGWSMGTFSITNYLKTISYEPEINKWAVFDSTSISFNELLKWFMENILALDYYNEFYVFWKYIEQNFHFDINEIRPGYDLEKLTELKCLYIGSKRDKVIPISLGKAAYESKIATEVIPHSEWVEYDCGHIKGIKIFNDEYVKNLKVFFKIDIK